MIPARACIIFVCLFLLGLILPICPVRAEVISADSATLSVDLDSGALVRLQKQATAVFVANPAVADVQIKTPTLVYIYGKAAGETTLFAVDEHEQVLLSKKIVVNYSLTRLKESIKTMAPDAKINVSAMDGGIVLNGQTDTAADAENIRNLAAKFVGSTDAVINNMHITGANQVNLRIRVAEVSRDVLKNVGFNWDYLLNPLSGNRFLFGLATGGRAASTGATTFSTRFVDPDTFMTNNSLVGGFRNGTWDINGAVDLLEGEGLINVLAEPNLTALSGETANFLAGGEFPVPVAQQNDQITIEFKPFGIGLAFTPTIVGGNRISMRIRPEVSQLSNQGAIKLNNLTIPAITTRRAETTIEVGSGQSFAIAGLIQHSTQEDINKYPGLGDLPILGALFKSDRFRRKESELVIIATPYLVSPTSQKMLTPQDGMRNATDAERVVGGHSYESLDTPQPKVPTAGFVTE